MATFELVISAAGAQRGAQEFLRATGTIESGSRRANAAVASMERQLSSLPRGIGGIASSFNGLNGTFGVLGNTVGALTGQFAGLFGAFTAAQAVKQAEQTFRSFESQMTTLGQVSRATAQQLTDLAATAQQLGGERGGVIRSAEAMTTLARAGFSVEETLQNIAPVLNLASAAQIGLADSASFVANSLRQFNLASTESARVTDVLLNASNASNQSVSDLGQALKFAGPVAQQFGLSIEETAAALAVLANQGIRGTLGGTGLRRVLGDLVSPTAQAQQQLEALGLSVADLNVRARGLDAVALTLKQSGITIEQAFEVFGVQGAGIAKVLADYARELDPLVTKISELGVAQEAAAARMATAQGQADRLSGAIENLSINAGEAFEPAFLLGRAITFGIVTQLDAAVTKFDQLSRAIENGISFGDQGALDRVQQQVAAQEAARAAELAARGAEEQKIRENITKAWDDYIIAVNQAKAAEAVRDNELIERANKLLDQASERRKTLLENQASFVAGLRLDVSNAADVAAGRDPADSAAIRQAQQLAKDLFLTEQETRRFTEQVNQLLVDRTRLKRDADLNAENTRAIEQARTAGQTAIDNLRLEISLVGQSADERQRAVDLANLQNTLQALSTQEATRTLATYQALSAEYATLSKQAEERARIEREAAETQKRAADAVRESQTNLQQEIQLVGLSNSAREQAVRLTEFQRDAFTAFGAGTEEATRRIEAFRGSLGQLEELRRIEGVANAIGDSFGTALNGIIDKAVQGQLTLQDLGGAFQSLQADIAKGVLNEVVTKPIVDNIKTSVFGSLAGGQSTDNAGGAVNPTITAQTVTITATTVNGLQSLSGAVGAADQAALVQSVQSQQQQVATANTATSNAIQLQAAGTSASQTPLSANTNPGLLGSLTGAQATGIVSGVGSGVTAIQGAASGNNAQLGSGLGGLAGLGIGALFGPAGLILGPIIGQLLGGLVGGAFAEGGFVGGAGVRDNTLSLTTPGEFVVRREVAQDNARELVELNRSGRLPGGSVTVVQNFPNVRERDSVRLSQKHASQDFLIQQRRLAGRVR